MLFRKYGSVAGNNFFTRHKGKSNGRLNAYNFEKNVRKPFADKTFQESLLGKRSQNRYNVYSCSGWMKRQQISQLNKVRSPSYLMRKQLKANETHSYPLGYSYSQSLLSFPNTK